MLLRSTLLYFVTSTNNRAAAETAWPFATALLKGVYTALDYFRTHTAQFHQLPICVAAQELVLQKGRNGTEPQLVSFLLALITGDTGSAWPSSRLNILNETVPVGR